MELSGIDFDIMMANLSDLFNVDNKSKNVIRRNEAILRIPGARKHFDGSLITPSREPIQISLASGFSNSSRQ